MYDLASWLILALTSGVLALLLPFAFHRSWLLWAVRRRGEAHAPPNWSGPLPLVTIQLPVYNEANVVARLIDAACRVDYPRGQLEIQVLDDSSDETSHVAGERARFWRRRGIRISHLRRRDRQGFKAGALAWGLERADGEFVVVLDADFVAPRSLIRDLLPPFVDPGVGMVQARWDHLNEKEGWLTRAQALLLDGHFFFEQGGRFALGRFFNFNGTAGMWRRRCLTEAGGWEADTLTEDLDLSYRAQMKGWRFVYRGDVGVPAELPSTVGALEVQQKRWAQGGIQTARKLLPRLLRGPWSPAVKLEAAVHLCGHVAHPLTLALGLLIYPAALARRALDLEKLLALDLLVFAAATVPFAVFYAAAGRCRRRPWRSLVPSVAVTLALGVGLSAPVSRAVVRGLGSSRDPFVRTPKRGGRRRSGYAAGSGWPDAVSKLVLGALMVAATAAAAVQGFWGSIPFLLLFASGWLGLGVGGLRGARPAVSGRGGLRSTPLADGAYDVVQQETVHGHPDQEADRRGLWPDPGRLVGAESPVTEEGEAA